MDIKVDESDIKAMSHDIDNISQRVGSIEMNSKTVQEAVIRLTVIQEELVKSAKDSAKRADDDRKFYTESQAKFVKELDRKFDEIKLEQKGSRERLEKLENTNARNKGAIGVICFIFGTLITTLIHFWH